MTALSGPEAVDDSPIRITQHVDLERYGLSELVACSVGLREVVEPTTSLEEAAEAVSRFLFESLRDGLGDPGCALVRVFATARTGELPASLRPGSATADEPCLVLLGTAGTEPAWNDRRQSVAHQVVPLGDSGEALAGLPMVQALFHQFGVTGQQLDERDLDLALQDFGVFHVAEALDNELIPGQTFVREHGVRSVLGFGCALPDGRVVAVLLFSRVAINPPTADLFKALAVSLQVAVGPLADHPLLAGGQAPAPIPAQLQEGASRRALEQLVSVLGEAVQVQSAQLRAEAGVVDELRSLGAELATELELDRLVDAVVSAGVRTTGAQFGAFFYNKVDAAGHSYVLYSVAGVDRSHFAEFPMPSATAVFAPTFNGEGPVRSADITQDARYGRNPHGGMPPGHLPVRSYLAASVVSRSGEVLGGLFFGHAQPDVFDGRAEALAVGLAGHAAIGIDNARLFQGHRDAAVELQRSLLPGALGDVNGLTFSSHYQPGAATSGVVVGGDWYDVLPLEDGQTAFVIGDVMGRGVRAAAAMGQLRTALRVLLASGQPLDQTLEHLDRLVSGLPGEQIATCLVGLHDRDAQTITVASAGHLPALLLPPDRPPSYLAVEPAAPLGALVVRPVTTQLPFLPGSTLLLFTDGLVEDRAESIDLGLERLLRLVRVHEPATALADLVESMLSAGQDDDTAVLAVTALDR